jgi:hypothetical protein
MCFKHTLKYEGKITWDVEQDCFCNIASKHYELMTDYEKKMHFRGEAKMKKGRPTGLAATSIQDAKNYYFTIAKFKEAIAMFCHPPIENFKMKNAYDMVKAVCDKARAKVTDKLRKTDDYSSDSSDSIDSVDSVDSSYPPNPTAILSSITKHLQKIKIHINISMDNQASFNTKRKCYVPYLTLFMHCHYNWKNDTNKFYLVIQGKQRYERPNKITLKLEGNMAERDIIYAIVDEMGNIYPTGHYFNPVTLLDMPKEGKYMENVSRDIQDFLKLFEKEPWEISGELGKLGNYCIFCQKKLTNKASLSKGYGKDCAETWGAEDIIFSNSVITNDFGEIMEIDNASKKKKKMRQRYMDEMIEPMRQNEKITSMLLGERANNKIPLAVRLSSNKKEQSTEDEIQLPRKKKSRIIEDSDSDHIPSAKKIKK